MCVVKDFYAKLENFQLLIFVCDVSTLFLSVHIYFSYDICLTLAAKRKKEKS